MLTLIRNGEVYTPEHAGRASVLLANDRIEIIGSVSADSLEASGFDLQVLDASDGFVVPGVIDPHAHLLGGSGEDGFSTQTPEIFLSELIRGGTTTVIGCLGVDTTMKTLPGLLAKAFALEEEGLTTYVYTGGYDVPPTTVLDSAREDLMFITKIVGVGETAISDERVVQPTARDLARVMIDATVGGLLSQKPGITHLHVGARATRLHILRDVLDEFGVKPTSMYPSHCNRTPELMEEAIDLQRRGVTIDFDVAEGNLEQSLSDFDTHEGDWRRLTISSDASGISPTMLWRQVAECVRTGRWRLERLLPLVTSNTAAALKLPRKGRLAEGLDADVVVIDRDKLTPRHVIARGKVLMRDGRLVEHERFLESSNREVTLHGKA
jgi:beta-aspartyl-dipeptidase (metallo-type)